MRVIDHRQFGRYKPQPKKHVRGVRILVWSVGIIVAAFIVLNVGMWLAYRNKVLPHYRVGAADVGGVAFRDIGTRVTADAVLPAQLTLTHDSKGGALTPAALGIHSDTAATIARLKASRPSLPVLSLVMHHTVPVQVAVDDSTFTTAAIGLQKTFTQQPVGRHVAYQNGAFAVAEPTAGYTLNVTGLKTAATQAIATGKTVVAVPVTTQPAPVASGDLQPEVQKLQKQLATPISFVYGAKTHKPSASDIGSWYVADGNSMSPSPDRISAYISATAKQLGVDAVNTNDAVTASIYALGKNQTLNFRLVSTQAAHVYRYCVAQRGLDDSVLPALKLKLAATYSDTRGWNDNGRIGFVYSEQGCQLHVWLAAPSTMASFGSICDDYYSCTVYPNVVINNDRWVGATDPWNAQHLSMEEYDAMVINHESGHWLGFDHVSCPGAGQPAPVMQQQSVDLQGCTFNAWPLPSEANAAPKY